MTMEYTTLFLDRDGVINHKIDGDVKSSNNFRFIDGVKESIAFFSTYFQRIIIVTNQQGIGKGLMTKNELNVLHDYMLTEINKFGGNIDKIYFCPHLFSESCECRKPNSGMLIQAKSDFVDIDFSKSILVGDSNSDILAAENVGVKAIKVSANYTLLHWKNEFFKN